MADFLFAIPPPISQPFMTLQPALLVSLPFVGRAPGPCASPGPLPSKFNRQTAPAKLGKSSAHIAVSRNSPTPFTVAQTTSVLKAPTEFPSGSKTPSGLHSTSTQPKSSRIREYLVTEWELLVHNFPSSMKPGYRPTKPKYMPIDDASPLFALDCEMCVTIDWQTGNQQSELTRVSLMNERGEVVLDTLVRPRYPIIDYVTFFSGITEKMMKNVMTQLADAQAAVAAILPPDAVLVGHSLNCDLHALKMSHPYCIDTSLLYNLTGDPMQRTSLRHLAAVFLGRQIQIGIIGHCSVEDSAVALQLAQLKIGAGSDFGNVLRGYCLSELPYLAKYMTDSELRRSEMYSSNDSVESDSDSLSDPLPFKCVDCGKQLHVSCPDDLCPCWDRKRRESCVRCTTLYAINKTTLTFTC